MYENETEHVIENRMLGRVPSDIDKREGSLIYDATMPAAIELMLLYAVADYMLKNTFGDTADREWLIERAKERGLAPYEAFPATVQILATPASAILPTGSRYSYDDVNYRITEYLGAGKYEAVCETAGTAGNKPAGRVIPIEYVQGLQYAELTEVISPGEDVEDTETFRKRYLASFETQAYGGNIADYQEKVNAIPGVGGVKVYPVWNGGGTVKIVFMTAEYKPPAAQFVSQIQEMLDPVPYAQKGVGIAPIGHRVTVEGVTEQTVDIGLHITFKDEATWETYQDDIKETINAYFAELNAAWQRTETVTTAKYENRGITVRISQIESRLLARPYVSDISHTTLDGKEENVELATEALAALGEVTNGG